MRIVWIGGSHPRHLKYINTIMTRYSISGAIIEKREHILPIIPHGTNGKDISNFNRHFKERDIAEKKYFGQQRHPNCEIMWVSKEQLNTNVTVGFIKKHRPNIVLIFGSSMIRDPLFSSLPLATINLHLGLSPRYRGAATLFWPFYFLEPNWAGATFHYITSEPDAGDIVHQVVPKLEIGDGIHDIACKVVNASTDAVMKLLRIYDKLGDISLYTQRGTGKNFLNSDFKPEHLRIIYDLLDNKIVDMYLRGEIRPKKVQLFSQFN